MLHIDSQQCFDKNAKSIHVKHISQTEGDYKNLYSKYKSAPILGEVTVWEAIEKLSFAIDPTDKELYNVSQWTHTLQVIESMEKKNENEELIVAGWLHDLGKILLTTNEAPENIVCDNGIIKGKEKSGLDNCLLNWNHDEFAYMRVKEYVPYHISWIIRYHSIKTECLKYMNENDMKLYKQFLIDFKKHDKLTKSIHHMPKIDLEKHKKIIEKHIPGKILI